MKTMKIPVHSVIDIITNSSSEIFCNSEKSIEPAKDLINEMLRLMGSDKTCDDIFEISLEDSNDENFEGYEGESYIDIKVLDPAYSELANKLYLFLYSPEHEEGYPG